MKILVINGPNINMLGIREKNIYGYTSYDVLIKKIQLLGEELGIEIQCYQSNHEGDLVDEIQRAYFESVDAIVINPGAYTHTSIAILDALKAVAIPSIEVHISNVNEREEFRKKSYIRDICVKSIIGKGIDGYKEAIMFFAENLKK